MRRICIVTGASSGMGACFARQLARESADFRRQAAEMRGRGRGEKAAEMEGRASDELWLIARRADRLEQTKALIERDAAGSPQDWPAIRAVPLDISGKAGAAAVRDLLAAENARLPQGAGTAPALRVTVLVNNAGFGTYGEFAATDTEREMDMVDVDCTALTGITGYALPYMARGSRLINTASLASFLPLGNFAVYGACKAFVLSLTVALAAELRGRGITVTALCPGPVSTEFAAVASRGARTQVRHGLPADRTVAHCLRQSRRGRLYSLWAFRWKFQAAASRLVGRYAGAWFTYRFCKRPSN